MILIVWMSTGAVLEKLLCKNNYNYKYLSQKVVKLYLQLRASMVCLLPLSSNVMSWFSKVILCY